MLTSPVNYGQGKGFKENLDSEGSILFCCSLSTKINLAPTKAYRQGNSTPLRSKLTIRLAFASITFKAWKEFPIFSNVTRKLKEMLR